MSEEVINRTTKLVHDFDSRVQAVGPDGWSSHSGLKPLDDAIRRPGVFGPKVEPPSGADTQTELLCFVGRSV